MAKNADNPMRDIPRAIYRHVFDYLFYSRGYMQDWTKGELALTIFYEKRFSKQREIYLKYCHEIAKSISRQFNVDIFLLFKLNDDWIIDVIKGIRCADLPVVVHDREHGIAPKRMEKYPPYLFNTRIYSTILISGNGIINLPPCKR